MPPRTELDFDAAADIARHKFPDNFVMQHAHAALHAAFQMADLAGRKRSALAEALGLPLVMLDQYLGSRADRPVPLPTFMLILSEPNLLGEGPTLYLRRAVQAVVGGDALRPLDGETLRRECLALMDDLGGLSAAIAESTRPDSDGGEAITDDEAAVISGAACAVAERAAAMQGGGAC